MGCSQLAKSDICLYLRRSKDRDALFALTLSSELQADYAALIEKRNLASLR
jgi:hypothetical protein